MRLSTERATVRQQLALRELLRDIRLVQISDIAWAVKLRSVHGQAAVDHAFKVVEAAVENADTTLASQILDARDAGLSEVIRRFSV